MVKFLKNKDYPVKSPKFNLGKDAGIDFFVPSYSEAFEKAFKAKNPNLTIEHEMVYNKDLDKDVDQWFVRVPPHGDINVPSGIYSNIPENIALVALNKSGIATGKKLIFGAQVIDASYQGIIHLHMINTSSEHQKVILDQKLVQFLPLVIDISGVSVEDESKVSHEDFYNGIVTDRGSGAFGSTGLN